MKSLMVCLIGLLVSAQASLASLPVISGQVRLSDGLPVAGAQVVLFDLADLRRGAVAHATTDEAGQFALATLGTSLPQGFALGQNYPNPFNPATIIPYQLAATSQVRLDVFNTLGQRMATLVNGNQEAGSYRVQWDGTDAAGRAAAAGLYFYRLTVEGAHQTGRMVLVDGQAGVPMGAGSVEVLPMAVDASSAYGLVVSGPGMVTYVDSDFGVAAGMGPVDIEVEAWQNVRMKVTRTQSEILGDVNNNNRVDIDDGLLVAMYSVNSSTSMPNSGDISLGDVNCNGQVDFTDARLIMTYLINPSDPVLPSGIGRSGGCSASEQAERSFDPSAVEAIDFEEDLSGSHTGELSTSSNANDYYRFKLDDTRTMSLSVNKLTADANLTLYDESGVEIERSEYPGKVDESIYRTLPAGTYYVRIQAIQTSGTIGYQLHYNASYNDGSRSDRAIQLGNLTNETVVGSWSGDVHHSNNPNDYYSFTLNNTRTITIRLGSLTTDANLFLEDESRSGIERSENAGTDEDLIVHTLSPGTYYIRVVAPADVVAGYQLSYQTQTNSGQSRSEPIEFGNLAKGRSSGSWSGDVHSTNNANDYYRFKLDDTRTMSLSVNKLTADANLTLYDESGVEIERSEYPGKVDESIYRTLPAGTYYVRIQAIQTNGTIGYQLHYNASYNDGSRSDRAIQLGNLTNETVVGSWSGDVHHSNNPNDYYSFTLNNTRTITIRLGSLTTDANLFLEDESRSGIERSENAGTDEDLIVHTLSPGTYYIRVQATADVVAGYQLSYQTQTNSGQSRSEPIEFGNLAKGRSSGSWSGDVHSTNNADDYYRFKLDDTRTMSLSVNKLTADANLTLYDESGVEIERSEYPGKVDESIYRTLPAGTYYVRIQAIQTNGTIGYQLHYNASYNDGSRSDRAIQLGNLTNETVVGSWSGDVHHSNNPNDYYSFTLNNTRTITIRLGSLTTDANLFLEDESRSGIERSENAGTDEDLIVHTLSPGTYYIRVQATADVVAGYQLSYSVAEEE